MAKSPIYSQNREVALAELTQTFDKGDLTFFFPLMADTQLRLGFYPQALASCTNSTATALPYKALYKQRTATKRINPLALGLGIERPKLRNDPAIANQNTLIRAEHLFCAT